ncbi:CPBP family intramembrane metalloprotease [Neobacillus mesonae]|nr:CPBP family intramembrane metalloprotease [Neobacillus mesonae]
MILSLVIKESYVYSTPENIVAAMPTFFILLLANCIVSQYSGYHPVGKFNVINFVVVFPVIEEVIFRGFILSLLNSYLNSAKLFEILYLPISWSVVVSAFLFAVCHLQYYKLSRQSAGFLGFAFAGGILFGGITELTDSILLSCILHIEFNFLAVYFARKLRENNS